MDGKLGRIIGIGSVICLMLMPLGFSAQIEEPPPVQPRELEAYLQTLYFNLNSPAITSTAPNGSRKAKQKGEMVTYNNGGTFEIWINTDGDTTWQKIGP